MPTLYLHNSLTNQREVFAPIERGRVTLYVCGPTVYGPVHIGNARPPVVFDVLYRLLRTQYAAVCYARNITDIDDKIIAAAAQNGESAAAVAARWQADYLDNMTALAVLPPDVQPQATAFIPQMVALIRRLLERGFAYENAGHILFHTPAYAQYGQLSNRNRDDMIAGARVEVAPYKKDPADFVLWKPAAADAPGWDSPWGRGRPGWHIECSAMAAACLGEQIDIHGGGQDLIFPHHENEIAQSCCAYDTPFFARYWLHNGFVHLDGEKMSKSQGNVRLLSDILSAHNGEAVRLTLLSTHYRQPLNWSAAVAEDGAAVLNRWYRLTDGEAVPAECPDEIVDALCNDINTPAAMAAMHTIAGELSQAQSGGDEKRAAVLRGRFLAGGKMLGVLQKTAAAWFHRRDGGAQIGGDEIEQLIQKRNAARRDRDFKTADDIRRTLDGHGIVLEDTADKTLWRRK